jgi:release factor glutamine methyltransferase
LDFELNSSVLIPRAETEELVELVVKNHKNSDSIKIIDIGTGSGCIAISLAKLLPNSTVSGIDVSDDALSIAETNAAINFVTNIHFEKIDFLTNCNFLKNYDVLVSNPPYISKKEYESSDEKEIFFEPRLALTDDGDGLTFYKKFAEISSTVLNAGTKIYLEVSYNQSNSVAGLFSPKNDVIIHKDFSRIERMIEVCVNK